MAGMTVGSAVLVFMTVVGAARAVSAQQARDESEIRDVQSRQQQAWNQHDAKAYADLFTADGDVINVVGWLWHGHQEIETKLTAAYAIVFRDSTLKVEDTKVKFLSADIAVAYVRWSMQGSKMPRGMPEPRQGIQTQVLQKQQDGKWLISAFQNTNSIPERPFPTEMPPTTPPARP